MTGKGSLFVLNVVDEKCLISHFSSLGIFSSVGGNGTVVGFVAGDRVSPSLVTSYSGRGLGTLSAVTSADAMSGAGLGKSSGTSPKSLQVRKDMKRFLAVGMK